MRILNLTKICWVPKGKTNEMRYGLKREKKDLLGCHHGK